MTIRSVSKSGTERKSKQVTKNRRGAMKTTEADTETTRVECEDGISELPAPSLPSRVLHGESETQAHGLAT